MRLGLITGTGLELPLADVVESSLETPYGHCAVERGLLQGCEALLVRRHGRGHEWLSSRVGHRQNIWALREQGAQAIVATTVCGVVDPLTSLAQLLLFDDLFFPDNRLPNGGPCTYFDRAGDPERGHLLLGSPFSTALRALVRRSALSAGLSLIDGGIYAYSLGPRFNSRAEIAWLRSLRACAVSQTAGPEAVLAGELEIPYCLVGFGIDYANGAVSPPTSVDQLVANLDRSKGQLESLLAAVAEQAAGVDPMVLDTAPIYRIQPS